MEKVPRVMGRALKSARCGMDSVVYEQEAVRAAPESIWVSSPAFEDGGPMAAKYTLDGEHLSPPLAWDGVPPGTAALVLLVEDADSPTPKPITHVLVSNLAPQDGALVEGALGERYTPPDPPPGHGPHRYVYQLYALGRAPERPIDDKKSLLKAIKGGSLLARGRLIGTYERA